MHRDDVVREIRTYREAYAKRFGYDLRAMYQDFKEKERQREKEIVPSRHLPKKEKTETS